MKNTIDLLGILFAGLIVLVAIFRAFRPGTKGMNGLTIFFGILLLIIGLIRYNVFPWGKPEPVKEPKPLPLTVSRHSQEFNNSLQSVIENYYLLSSAFSKTDTSAISSSAASLLEAVGNLNIDELKTDSLIYQTALQPHRNIKQAISLILVEKQQDLKRRAYHQLSNELFSLLSIVRYDLARVHWFECNDGLGENEAGNWFSDREDPVNPYAKEDCTEIKTTLNFVPDSTKKP